jgi:hypothetical protein
MKGRATFATGIAAAVASLGLAARLACAAPLTYGITRAGNAAAAAGAESLTFDVSGTSVSVTVTDPTSAGARGGPEALTARFVDASARSSLSGTAPAEPAYEGSHDFTSCDVVAGWAWNPQLPDKPIAVNIYADETLVDTVTADQFRKDLLDAHIGNGYHSFVSPLPASLKDGTAHQIRVSVAGSDFDLGNTPKAISCAPAAHSK